MSTGVFCRRWRRGRPRGAAPWLRHNIPIGNTTIDRDIARVTPDARHLARHSCRPAPARVRQRTAAPGGNAKRIPQPPRALSTAPSYAKPTLQQIVQTLGLRPRAVRG